MSASRIWLSFWVHEWCDCVLKPNENPPQIKSVSCWSGFPTFLFGQLTDHDWSACDYVAHNYGPMCLFSRCAQFHYYISTLIGRHLQVITLTWLCQKKIYFFWQSIIRNIRARASAHTKKKESSRVKFQTTLFRIEFCRKLDKMIKLDESPTLLRKSIFYANLWEEDVCHRWCKF